MQALHTPEQAVQWLRARVTGTLHTDSRRVGAGDGFIAWPGAATDGRQHVSAALAQGAAACLVEQDGVEPYGFSGSQVASYRQLKAATGPLAAAYYGEPSTQLDVVAVTGTNGKTSTAWWVAQALSGMARPCAVVGTLGIGIPPDVVYNGLTTPDPVLLQQQFRRLVDAGTTVCAIEASSIGLAERRLDGTQIKVAVFTNFTQDHLDYHGDMSTYWAAKAALFTWPGLQAAVVNVDDAQGQALYASLQSRGLDLWSVSAAGPARLQAQGIGLGAQGLRFTVVEGQGESREQHVLSTHLIGQYNVSNLLGVIAALRALGVPLADAVAACRELQPVPGRMECLNTPDQPLVAIDYAHTPDALDKALSALRPVSDQRGGKLWCIFGCGGDRDASKRPLMGAVACQGADGVVVTSDNPRSEDAGVIIQQILQGVPHTSAGSVRVEGDRAVAIASAVAQADARDVVLIAGKGHEDYQETAGVRRAFSDKAEAHRALQARGAVTWP